VVTLFISPMLVHKAEQPFVVDDFITELKLSRPNYKKNLIKKGEYILAMYNILSFFLLVS
jgi:hypothetical protein